MAPPTALQRTSDERWVTFANARRSGGRWIARVREEPSLVAAIRRVPARADDADDDYAARLTALLEAPPPEAGTGVSMAWPVDLLHDLDGRIVGYLAVDHRPEVNVRLSDFLEPAARAEVAPLATRRHLLRAGRNTATAVAALHHAGHGGLTLRNLRLDDRSRIRVIRVDELTPRASLLVRQQDLWLLHGIVHNLVEGRPWSIERDLIALLAQAEGGDLPTAAAWFHALRAAEKALPPGAYPVVRERPTTVRITTRTPRDPVLDTVTADLPAWPSAADRPGPNGGPEPTGTDRPAVRPPNTVLIRTG